MKVLTHSLEKPATKFGNAIAQVIVQVVMHFMIDGY